MNKKTENLESLSLSKIKKVLFDILEKEGYQNLKTETNESNIITGEINQGLSILVTTFFISQEILSGNEVQVEPLVENIKLVRSEERRVGKEGISCRWW